MFSSAKFDRGEFLIYNFLKGPKSESQNLALDQCDQMTRLFAQYLAI